ncbi:MAG: sodium-dependent transporter [Pseudomonadota bacterium]
MKLPRPIERWQSRTTFMLALSLAVMGLGNVARFPWLLGENGGAPFMLTYVLCLLGVSVPLLIAELCVGQHGRGSPLTSLRWAAEVSGVSQGWLLVAVVACLGAATLAILATVFGGWALSYAYDLQLGRFAAVDLSQSAQALDQNLAVPSGFARWQLLFAMLTLAIAAAGVRRGLGLFAWIALPALVTLLAALSIYAVNHGDLSRTNAYLFIWQELDYDRGSFLAALGFAIYTLSAGVAVGLSYGAYAPAKVPLVRCVLAVALFDTVVAVTVSVIVVSLTASANLLPDQGISLVFVALPFAFGSQAFGDVYGALFYLALALMLLGSATALLEPLIASLASTTKLNRWRSAVVCTLAVWSLSAAATLNLARVESGYSFLQLLDSLASLVLMPLSLVLVAIFAGWCMPVQTVRRELGREPYALFRVWYFVLRYVSVPVVLIAWLWLYAVG